MKTTVLCVLFLILPAQADPIQEPHDTIMMLRTNGDFDSIDISKQDPETRKILHKIAYQQYLKNNQWATFKAALAACGIVVVVVGAMGFLYLQTK